MAGKPSVSERVLSRVAPQFSLCYLRLSGQARLDAVFFVPLNTGCQLGAGLPGISSGLLPVHAETTGPLAVLSK